MANIAAFFVLRATMFTQMMIGWCLGLHFDIAVTMTTPSASVSVRVCVYCLSVCVLISVNHPHWCGKRCRTGNGLDEVIYYTVISPTKFFVCFISLFVGLSIICLSVYEMPPWPVARGGQTGLKVFVYRKWRLSLLTLTILRYLKLLINAGSRIIAGSQVNARVL